MSSDTSGREACVIGSGMIDFGELFDQSTDDMAERAYLNALDDVDHGISPSEIDAAWFGTLDIANDVSSGASLAHATGLFEIPVTRVENACATGSTAFRSAAAPDLIERRALDQPRRRIAHLLDAEDERDVRLPRPD